MLKPEWCRFQVPANGCVIWLLLTHVQVILANIFSPSMYWMTWIQHIPTNTHWHSVTPVCVFGGERWMCVGVWSVLILSWTICLLPGGPMELDSQHICLPAFVDHHHGGVVIPVPVYFSTPSQNKLHLSIKLWKTVKVSSHPVQLYVKYPLKSVRDSVFHVYVHLHPARKENVWKGAVQDSAHVFSHDTGSVSHLPLWPQTARFQPTS